MDVGLGRELRCEKVGTVALRVCKGCRSWEGTVTILEVVCLFSD